MAAKTYTYCKYKIDENKTGVELIDKYHEKYVKLINCLVDILNSSNHEFTLIDFFYKLIFYTENYFVDEELYFRKNNYNNIKKHKESHAYFIEKINQLKEAYIKGEEDVGERMLKFLDKWFREHIAVEDIKAVKEIQTET